METGEQVQINTSAAKLDAGVSLDEVNLTPVSGLTAAQVQERTEQGKVNFQDNKGSKSVKQIVRDNVFTFFNLINIILAVLIIMVGSFRNLFFMGVVLSNTAIGIIQEIRAKRVLDKLALITAAKVRVRRDGQEEHVEVDQVVLDDMMILASGNQITADAIVREGSLEVNESLISGESEVILKHPGDSVLSGSFVVSGRASVQVVHVGEENFAHKILSEAKTMKKYRTGLQRALDTILKVVSVLIVPLGVGLFATQFYVNHSTFQDSIVNMVAAVLGMIPEGLMLLTSIALAVSVINLAKYKTLVHEMFCIETLARVDVLCLDKTGTLTEGRMKVESVIPLEEAPVDEILSNLAGSLEDDNATFQAVKEHFPAKKQYRPRTLIPFSSARKYSGAAFEDKGTYLMGAFEFMFPEGAFPEVKEQIDRHTAAGIRVLTLAYTEEMAEEKQLPGGLKPLAIILISDVIRKEAKETLQFFDQQGVDLMVISGDNPATVSHIAEEAGFKNASAYVDASTLKTAEQLKTAVEKYKIFGRVTPVQKKQIVLALQANKHTVAMTGDGVNDVPALKAADVSIAMASGSEAAQNTANLVLLDSNFSAMPHVVNEGRRVINNIQSAASLFLVKTIFSFLLTIMTLATGTEYPFVPIQLSLISVFAVGIPNFFLTLEPNYRIVEPNFLSNVFRNALQGAMTIVLQVVIISIAGSWLGVDENIRSTMCVLTTSVTSIMMIKEVFPLTTLFRRLIYCAMYIGMMLGLLIAGEKLLYMETISFNAMMIVLMLVVSTPITLRALRWVCDKAWVRCRRLLRYSKKRVKRESRNIFGGGMR